MTTVEAVAHNTNQDTKLKKKLQQGNLHIEVIQF